MYPTAAYPMRRRAGFTLIELLVVISIIALLIAILLPALGAARQAAQSTTCLSNTRQMGLAIQMYADEYNGFFPAGFDNGNVGGSNFNDPKWYAQRTMGQYLQGVDAYRCPTDAEPVDVTTEFYSGVSGGADAFISYMYNPGWDRTAAYRNRDSVNSPSRIRVIGDRGDGNFDNGTYTYDSLSNWERQFPFLRHGESVNFTFLDGHGSTEKGAANNASTPEWSRQTTGWFVGGSAFEIAWDPGYFNGDVVR